MNIDFFRTNIIEKFNIFFMEYRWNANVFTYTINNDEYIIGNDSSGYYINKRLVNNCGDIIHKPILENDDIKEIHEFLIKKYKMCKSIYDKLSSEIEIEVYDLIKLTKQCIEKCNGKPSKKFLEEFIIIYKLRN